MPTRLQPPQQRRPPEFHGSSDSELEVDDAPSQHRLRVDAVPVPSWASRTDSEEGSLEPRTVLQLRRQSGESRKESRATNHSSENEERESHPVEPKASLDDVPTAGGKKTFNELLAEQLGCDLESIADVAETERVPESPAFVRRNPDGDDGKPKSFLRKGSGLTRYGGVGNPPKSFKRSKSQNNVSHTGDSIDPMRLSASSLKLKSATSCSRLDIAERETIAFASKKTPPKGRTPATSSSAKKTTANGASPQQNGGSTKPAGKRTTPSSSTLAGKSKSSVSGTNSTPSGYKASVANVARNKPPDPVASKKKSALSNGGSSAAGRESGGGGVGATAAPVEELSPVYDSVEWSFREKLKKADKTHKVILLSFCFTR